MGVYGNPMLSYGHVKSMAMLTLWESALLGLPSMGENHIYKRGVALETQKRPTRRERTLVDRRGPESPCMKQGGLRKAAQSEPQSSGSLPG